MEQATPLIVPQVNVNDDTVLLARWSVADGAAVVAADVVCDVETTKAASEILAGVAGVLVQSVAAGSHVRVGATIGAIAATREAAAAFLAARATVNKSTEGLARRLRRLRSLRNMACRSMRFVLPARRAR